MLKRAFRRLLVLIGTGAAFIACAAPEENGSADDRAALGQAVTDGTAATVGQFPFMVKVMSKSSTSHKFECGGTLINEWSVLTSAYCVMWRSPQSVSVGAGGLDSNSVTEPGLQLRAVSDIRIHPKYVYPWQEHDVAVLRLREPFQITSSVRPIELATVHPATGDRATAIGWGGPQASGQHRQYLAATDLNVAQRSVCSERLSPPLAPLSEDAICAGKSTGLGYACQRDVGGPLATYSLGKWKLAGVMNYFTGHDVCNGYTISSRVDRYHSWITACANTLSPRQTFGPRQVWHQNLLCDSATYSVVVGDYNGDGKDDIACGTRNSEVMVALSNGGAFGHYTRWGSLPGHLLKASLNGDNRDDIGSYTYASNLNPIVNVAASTGESFGAAESQLLSHWAPGWAEPMFFDATGDGRDDLVTLTRTNTGDVYVHQGGLGISPNKFHFFPGQKWNDWFCLNNESCHFGRFNGDGRRDLVTVTRDATHDVWVGINTGSSFSTSKWHDSFGSAGETAAAGHISHGPDGLGDSMDDLVLFSQNYSVTSTASKGTQFGPPVLEHTDFCGPMDYCTTADVNGDGFDDLIAYDRQNGKVQVAVRGEYCGT